MSKLCFLLCLLLCSSCAATTGRVTDRVFIGDSNTLGYPHTLEEAYPFGIGVNLGKGGSTSEDWQKDSSLPAFYRWLSEEAPIDELWIMLGSADAVKGFDAEEFNLNMRSLLDQVFADELTGQIVLMGAPVALKPSVWNPDVNTQLEVQRELQLEICLDYEAVRCGPNLYVLLDDEDYIPDNYHLTVQGHLHIREIVMAWLEEKS